MTRDELHGLVWSQPSRTLAKSFGISDVALAKHCRNVKVPVPPRGWWARKHAGKRVSVVPLPRIPIGAEDTVPLSAPRAVQAAAGVLPDAAEPEQAKEGPPTFGDIAVVSERIAAAVGKVVVPGSLANPHPVVARLLAQDETRRQKADPNRALYDWYGPKFDSAIQQRRLRILSAILFALERCGCKIRGNTHAGASFSIGVRGGWIQILFGVEGGRDDPFQDRHRGRRQPGERLRFDVGDSWSSDAPQRTWRDGETRLERLATEIVQGILLQAEENHRRAAVRAHQWRIEDRARRAKEAKLAAEKAEAERIAREKAEANARIDGLIAEADALERAERIRRYVAAVRAHAACLSLPIAPEGIERWATWALAEADRIDPVHDGRFLGALLRIDMGSGPAGA